MSKYVIGVDLQTKNDFHSSDKNTRCHSTSHEDKGRHFDFTIHNAECRFIGNADVDDRYWIGKDNGLTLSEVVDELKKALARHNDRKPYARRCSKCDVPSHRPDWD